MQFRLLVGCEDSPDLYRALAAILILCKALISAAGTAHLCRHDFGAGFGYLQRGRRGVLCFVKSSTVRQRSHHDRTGPADIAHRTPLSDMLTGLHRNGVLVLLLRIAFTIALALILTWLLPKTAIAVVRITDDRGGNIGAYWSRFMALRDAGEQIIIDGTCSSACTLVLGIVPHDRICVTQNAVLGFHAAWRPGFLGFEIINDPATRTLWNIYPMPIRQWISRNGGLGLATIYLSGPELFSMYRQCR